MRVCAIDMGTVTTRVLVADVSGGRLVELDRRSAITHLGEGLTASGTLSDAAMGRVCDAVSGYLERARELGAERVVALATSAARDASNADEFMSRLAALGVTPEVIAGEREAYLSFLGATYGLDGEGVLVADPGGGSTELIFGDASGPADAREIDIRAARSIDVGARRMTERFFAADPPSPSEIEAARAWAVDEFRPYFDALRGERASVLITLAGTATTLAAVKQRLDPYDSAKVHGHVLLGGEVSDMLAEFAAVPLAERRAIVGLEPDRASVIVAGVLVVETVMSLAGVDSTTVSEHDILCGIALDAASCA